LIQEDQKAGIFKQSTRSRIFEKKTRAQPKLFPLCDWVKILSDAGHLSVNKILLREKSKKCEKD
jgi:hypothetical protein